MPANTVVILSAPPAPRPSYRPPLGLPLRREGRWGSVASLLLHALIILLIFVPLFEHDVMLVATHGGGGLGPLGGGGGGNRGTGGTREEHIRFVAVAPAPAPSTALVAPQPPKPVPPPPPPKPEPPQIAKVDEKVDAGPPAEAVAPVAGVGGGTGNDGTGGMGPGTGGGIGTGQGTGIGSANGPGTGGGVGDTAMAYNSFGVWPVGQVPSLRGRSVKVLFALDARGKILEIQIQPSVDRSAERKLREYFQQFTFRPAFLRSSGKPVASVYETTMTF